MKKLGIVTFLAAGFVAGSLAPSALAQATDQQQERADQAKQRMAQMKDRLKLTPEQEEKIRPIFQEEVQKMREIRDKYAGQQTREARRSMMTEMKQVRDDMDKQLKDILTKDQMDELQKIRQERQGRMREQRGRR